MNLINQFKNFIINNKDLIGILDGESAFTGPELVQIDLTNSCNNDCIGCWCRSPLLEDKLISPEIERQTLPVDLVKKVLKECAEMGTTNIYLAGGGEPFVHPQIMEILAYIKELKLCCHINTNLTLVDKARARKIVEMGIDHLIVSLWAATPKTYCITHPNKTEKAFEKLMDTIEFILKLRQAGPPHIVYYNVIMNLNYQELEAMVELAAATGVNAVEFTVVDVIPGYTDSLLLDKKQQSEVYEACKKIKTTYSHKKDEDTIDIRIDDFMRRINNDGTAAGNYDIDAIDRIPCLIGWNFSRILADGNVNACLKSHRMPVGNIYKTPFSEIWNGPSQRNFRRKTRKRNKDDPFFSKIGNDDSATIGCYRSCDDM
jgi:MoaA/NifB/PqqE/SkfB family radical SAM enzyme